MKQYKRLLAAGLMVIMIGSLTGCATNNKTDESPQLRLQMLLQSQLRMQESFILRPSR